MRLLVFLNAVTGSLTEKILHNVHEIVGWVVLALVGAIFVLGGAQTYLMRHKTKIELAIDRNRALSVACGLCRSYLEPAYRKLFVISTLALCGILYRRIETGMLDRFNSIIASSVRKLSNMLFKHVELSGIDQFNYALAGALTDLCVRLRVRLDVVGSYYAAIVWFVGGALISLTLLLLV